MPEVTLASLLRSAEVATSFHVIFGHDALERSVSERAVQRVGVALTGYLEHHDATRIQVLGRSELGFLASLTPEARTALLECIVARGAPAFVVTCGLPLPVGLAELSEDHTFVVLSTDLESPEAIERLNLALSRHLAPRDSVHGVLVDVFGVGVLLTGKSGIGKSEVALELIAHGHRLVGDDLILVQEEQPGIIIGTAPELTRFLMEIRGLGLINIRDLYGAAAVRERKRVELVVELVEWDPDDEYDRLGLDPRTVNLVRIPISAVRLPVRPGRSMRLIVEVAARNRLLQAQGTHSARAFADRLAGLLSPKPGGADVE
jgi:HPr kinase/phosphorylase